MRKTKIATFGVLTAAAVAVPATPAFGQEAQSAGTHTHAEATARTQGTTGYETQGTAGYQVQPGDTLSEVAQRHGTTWQELAERNGLPDPDRIFPGQRLEVTGASTPQPAPSAPPPAQEATPETPQTSQAPQAQEEQSQEEAAPQATRSKPASSAASMSENAAKAEIIRRESSGNPNAQNGKYYGLFQTDQPWGKGTVAEQHAGAEHYVEHRYGSWQAALAFHNKHGWY
ncbi:LysM peptidoglycan-binding domain-containing protein [Streptomyces diacarni]|uniref:LysM peptidoglycan-binding domain-containing protein n=1 Tax=Streptomyces diacarni TaxID=2800381 RepID=A0A367EY04_9ACTN|nr:LysM peptidoglycan-binding domain-containing protein [Streptomyces diacarni]RCG23036.1 LysM peptidoglycan-binding domain-containing protein [Streptomyces diacarni]